LGLRAGRDGAFIVPQTTLERRPTMFFSLRYRMTDPRPRKLTASWRRPARFRPALEILEDRAVPAVWTVTTPLAVVGPGDGVLSLREAVLQANASGGPDTIVLPAGHFVLSLGELSITGDVTIQGAGASFDVRDPSLQAGTTVIGFVETR